MQLRPLLHRQDPARHGPKGRGPAFAGQLSSRHVPYGGILITATVFVAGVVLYYFVPERAFNIATAIASLGVVTTWGTLVFCQIRLRRAAERGLLERPPFRMPGSPYTGWLTLGFLALVVLLMPFADADQRIAFFCIPLLVVVIVAGWRIVGSRRHVEAPELPKVPGVPGVPVD